LSYDPFSRGPHPVGVRSADLVDEDRARSLAVEVWYPADPSHAGEDLADATRDSYQVLALTPPALQDAVRDATPGTGRHPLVAFSHGFAGHRRQTTHFCTHLASHGYVVVSVDHTGNTLDDMMKLVLAIQAGGAPPEPDAVLGSIVPDRPVDVSFAIDRVLDGTACDMADRVDAERIGVTGHSFGGWTTLQVTGRDDRIRAALPLAPAGGETHLPAAALHDALDLDWGRHVPTLYLVAEHDSLLPLDGMLGLLGRTPGEPRLVVLKDADHMHFCDRVEEVHEMFRAFAGMAKPMASAAGVVLDVRPMSDFCPGAHAYDFVRGLGLAHMDAHLKENAAAAALLAGDLEAEFASRGIAVATHTAAGTTRAA
jgi:dienelactone hydrolase